MCETSHSLCTVLVIDDHPVVLDGLSRLLLPKDGILVVGTATSYNEAFPKIRSHRPDIVLIDIAMPGMDGISACRQLLDVLPSQKVVLFTESAGEVSDTLSKSGATGSVSKTWLVAELVDALRKYAGLKALRTERTGLGNPARLSPRQIQVLSLLCDGLTSKEIAQTLALSPRTIESYKKHVMMKVNARNSVDLSRFAFTHGLAKQWQAETLRR